LYLGGAHVDPAFYRECNIEAVLKVLNVRDAAVATCRAGKCPSAQNAPCLHINISDSPTADLLAHFPTIVKFIDRHRDENCNVYVHCVKGISRSTTCLCAYLMVYLEIGAQEALAHIRSRRPMACPNKGFMRQLELFEASEVCADLTKKVSRRHKFYQEDRYMVTREFVMTIPDDEEDGGLANIVRDEEGLESMAPDGEGLANVVPVDVGNLVRKMRCPEYWDPDASRIAARRDAISPTTRSSHTSRILLLRIHDKGGMPLVTVKYCGENRSWTFKNTVRRLTFEEIRAFIHAYTSSSMSSTRKAAGVPPIFEVMIATKEPVLLWSLVALLFSLRDGESSFTTPRPMPVRLDTAVVAELIAVSKPEVEENEALKRIERLVRGTTSNKRGRPSKAQAPISSVAGTQPGTDSRSPVRKRRRLHFKGTVSRAPVPEPGDIPLPRLGSLTLGSAGA